jgi:hypothetical protein
VGLIFIILGELGEVQEGSGRVRMGQDGSGRVRMGQKGSGGVVLGCVGLCWVVLGVLGLCWVCWGFRDTLIIHHISPELKSFISVQIRFG